MIWLLPAIRSNVAAGAYNESLTIAKSLTLSCAQAGVPVGGRTAGSAAETVINASGLPVGVIVKASNVTVDGCDILGNTSTYAGVMLYASTGAGNLNTLQVKNNFIHGMALPNPSSTAYVTSYGVFGLGDAVGGVRNTLTGVNIQGNKIYDLGGAPASGDYLRRGRRMAVQPVGRRWRRRCDRHGQHLPEHPGRLGCLGLST